MWLLRVPHDHRYGEGGQYRYYKCASKIINVGKKECENGNVRMETLDRLVLQTVADKVFTPERVNTIIEGLQVSLKEANPDQNEQIRHLSRELEDIKQQTEKLFEAVEKGFIPMNASLHERVHKHEARRQEVLIELARLKHQKETPFARLSKKNIVVFCVALKEMLQDRTSQFGKQYLEAISKTTLG